MDPRLQRRVQRYGWSLAASDYEPLWRRQLEAAHAMLMQAAAPKPGERVIDVACGTGLVSFAAAAAVGDGGHVMGVDLSDGMIEAAQQRADLCGAGNVRFLRMDAERLDVPDASFDVALCALGLMYLPDPQRALEEMRRVVRPGGRIGVAVWGERARCGWAPVFGIVEARVASDVCPLFFGLGHVGALRKFCSQVGIEVTDEQRVDVMLDYVDADEACDAVFIGGPVALAWSRFEANARALARAEYLAAIDRWRRGEGYCVPGEFVIVTARNP